MEALKEMSWIKQGSIIVAFLGTLGGIFAVPWGSIGAFITNTEALYSNMDEIEHMIKDNHKLLELSIHLEATIDSLELEVKDQRHKILLLSRGKTPYDSLWLRGESGTLFMTTMEDHYKMLHSGEQ